MYVNFLRLEVMHSSIVILMANPAFSMEIQKNSCLSSPMTLIVSMEAIHHHGDGGGSFSIHDAFSFPLLAYFY